MQRVIKKVLLHILDRTTQIFGVLRDSESIWPCWIKTLDLPLKGDKQGGWKIHHIIRGPTASMKKFSSHVSVLGPGKIPHAPHAHEEEEVLILLSGEADIMTLDNGSLIAATERIIPGSIVYHAAHQKHTIQCVSPGPATYLIFKWTGAADLKSDTRLRTSVFRSAYNCNVPAIQSDRQIAHTVVFDSPTLYLRKLRCHISTLKPGASYPPHSDAYDVAILTLSGTVETLARQVGPCSIIFYAAGEPHGMKNADSAPARYIVIEFHGGNFRRKWFSLRHKGVHILHRVFRRPSGRGMPMITVFISLFRCSRYGH